MLHEKRKDSVPTALLLAGAAAGLFYAATISRRWRSLVDE